MRNPIRSIWNFIKSLFPNLNRAGRRRYWHQQRRKGIQNENLLERYHALWVKRPHGLGWWVRASRVEVSA